MQNTTKTTHKHNEKKNIHTGIIPQVSKIEVTVMGSTMHLCGLTDGDIVYVSPNISPTPGDIIFVHTNGNPSGGGDNGQKVKSQNSKPHLPLFLKVSFFSLLIKFKG